MTSTLTRPEAAPPAGAPAPGRPAAAPSGPWFATGDHKALGLLFLAGGLVALLVAAASAAVHGLASEPATQLWTQPGSRLAAAAVAAGLVLGVPGLWLGLATYVVPLQVGASRLALPRLHNLALWTWVSGGLLVAVAFVGDPEPVVGLGSSVPAGAGGEAADWPPQLMAGGLLLVAMGTFLAAAGILVTILNGRAEEVRLAHLPLFTWSSLATATVLVLTAPVLGAGLLLLLYDLHYGGDVFAGLGGHRIWQHQLWVLGQPLALLFAAACVGPFGDVVATHARRPIDRFGSARAAAVAAPALTLLLWAGNVSTLDSPFGPVATLGGVTVAAPLAFSLLVWADTLRSGRPRFHPSMAFVGAFLIVAGVAAALSVVALLTSVEGAEADAFRNGQTTLLVLGLPLLGLAGAAAHWWPKLTGRRLGGASLVSLLLLTGVLAMAVPGYAAGLGGSDDAGPVGSLGAGLVALGLLALLAAVVKPRRAGAADPYGGLTLEWATPSPPPPHNFDEVPPVRSPYPLAGEGRAD